MGRKLVYKPGSFYRVDDRTGFPERAENTKKQWNNIYTRERSFESRQPQDFVRGRKDDQTVPDARPLSQNVFLGNQTTLAVTAPNQATGIVLSAPLQVVVGNVLAIMMDNGVVYFGTIQSLGGDFNTDFGPLPNTDFSKSSTVVLTAPLPFQASAGAAVVNTDFIAVTANSLPPGFGYGYP
jgi:hypothetical protein